MNGVFLALTLGRPSSQVGEGALTPPTVAPVLSGFAIFGSNTAELSWTTSDKIESPGFGYRVYVQKETDPEGVAGITTALLFNYSDLVATGETYYFRVVPYNDAGDGPSSNTVSVILPGNI